MKVDSMVQFTIYAPLPTCNQFNHIEVNHQWLMIHDLHKKILKPTIGPLIYGFEDDYHRWWNMVLFPKLIKT